MAELKAYVAFDFKDIDFNYYIANMDRDVLQEDKDWWGDDYRVVTDTDERYSLHGPDFAYDTEGNMTIGTVQAVKAWEKDAQGDWTEIYHAYGWNRPMNEFYDMANSASTDDDLAMWKDVFSWNDKMWGSAFDDHIRGFTGADVIKGGGGADILKGDEGGDNIYGGNGFDKIYGGDHKDKLYGQKHNDKLFGGAGSDLLDGGKGNDKLSGDRGNDKLYGANGADQFKFKDGFDEDKIMDYVDGEDTINLAGASEITDFDDLVANHMSQDGANVVIDALNGDVLTVKNVTTDIFDAGDFIF